VGGGLERREGREGGGEKTGGSSAEGHFVHVSAVGTEGAKKGGKKDLTGTETRVPESVVRPRERPKGP